jgi:hypothetical protein
MRIVRVVHFSFITHVEERQLCIVNQGYAIVTKQQCTLDMKNNKVECLKGHHSIKANGDVISKTAGRH